MRDEYELKKAQASSQPGLYDTIFHRDYREATWFCAVTAILNDMSGISFINIYAA